MSPLEDYKDITLLSGYQTPARARYFYRFSSLEDIQDLQKYLSWSFRNNIPVLMVSGGTNMFFAFDTYEGLVVHNTLSGWNYDPETFQLTSYGSVSIWHIAEKLEKEYGQSIWHRFIGLPGSVAGAVYGNAGCFGLEIQHNFLSCKVLDIYTGEVLSLSLQDMDFSYRSSLLKKTKKYFLISADFDLSRKKEKYHSDVDNIYFREHMQPKGLSCGSFFKNPSITREDFIRRFPLYADTAPRNISAGYLLELCGLKGKHIGGAFFSQKHANFLMHDGHGKWTDLRDLISLAQKKVQESFGILLENEVQIIISPKK